MIAFLGAVLLVVIVLGVTALYYGAAATRDREAHRGRSPRSSSTCRAEQAQLELTAQWEDRPPEVDHGRPREKALVIPIEDAMEIVAELRWGGGR